MRFVRFAVALFLLVVTGSATSTAAPSCDDIERRINEQPPQALRDVWRELGVQSELFQGIDDYRLIAERYEIPFAPPGVPYVILRVSPSYGDVFQYLIFIKRDGCKYLGKIDLEIQKYKPPEHRIVPRGSHSFWLVLSIYGASGTGFYREWDTWHEINEKGVKKILEYVARGHDAQHRFGEATFGRQFTTTAVTHKRVNGLDNVEVKYDVSCYGLFPLPWNRPDIGVNLFDSRRTAWYVWNPSGQQFIFDPLKSDASEQYREWLRMDLIETTGEELVKHHIHELTTLAVSGSRDEREWLKQFLNTLDKATPDVQALRKKLR